MDIVKKAIAADTAETAAPIVWFTEAGTPKRMADITDAHLLAIIDFLGESLDRESQVGSVRHVDDKPMSADRHRQFLTDKRAEMITEAERRALIISEPAAPQRVTDASADPIVWHTADGRHLTMAQIDDKHLMNILPHIEDQIAGAQLEQEVLHGTEMGDDAKDAALSEISRDIRKLGEDLRVMTAEAERRGLISSAPQPE